MLDKKIHQQDEQIRRYLQNEMTRAERNAFEREMQKDPFLADAVDGLSTFSSEEIIADIQSLKTEIQKSRSTNRSYIWYAAASVLVILVSTFMLFNLEQKTNPVLTENIRKVEQEPQKEIVQEPQHLQVNDTEQKTVTTEKLRDVEVLREAVTEKEQIKAAVGTSSESKKEESAFTPNLAEQMKLKKSFAITENLKMAKVDSQQTVVSQEIKERYASASQQPIMQTVSNNGKQQAVEAAPAASQAMHIAYRSSQKSEAKAISGVVTDTTGSPLPGVTVFVKGTGNGTITDINGNYFIPNVQDSNSLVYSFVGMKTQEILAANKAQIDVALPADDLSLSEVVTVGYGVQKKADPIGAVSIDKIPERTNGKAIPSGGWDAYYKGYLNFALQHPGIGSPDKKVVVRLSFVVNETGKPDSFKILDSTNEKYNQTAIDIINGGPGWWPAVKDSVPQQEEVRMRLVFPPGK